MAPIDVISGTAAPLPGADIDTDQILPGRFMFKPRIDYGQYCFYDLRFHDDSSASRTEFVLNDPLYRNATILIVGPNFGCGSSREQAVHALHDYGTKAIIGTSFGDIFYSNCFKNGILAIRLEECVLAKLSCALVYSSNKLIEISLPSQQIKGTDGANYNFQIDSFNKWKLVNGVDEIDYTLGLEKYISDFERRSQTNVAPTHNLHARRTDKCI